MTASRHPSAGRFAGALVVLYLAAWGLAASRSRENRRTWVLRFIACTGAVLFGIAVFEVPAILGIVDYRVPFATPSPPWRRPGNRIDSELLAVKEGGRRIRESFTGNDVHWLADAGAPRIHRSDRRYDRDGFRNPRDFDRADVIVLGDSFVEGAHAAEDELITTRLAAELGGTETVVNLGQSGYGPEQELHVLRRYGLPRRPSVCVWAFYEGNDLADVADYAVQINEARESLRTGRGTAASLGERGFIANALGFVLRTWIDPAPRLPSARHRGWFEAGRGVRVPLYFASGDYRRESSSSTASTVALRRFWEILRNAHALCRNRGTRLIVMFIPTKLRVYRPFCAFESGSVCARWPVDDLPRVVGDLTVGASSEIEYLDLTPGFQAEAARGALLYLSDDTHWSAAGHRAAASLIVERIRDRPPGGPS